MPRKKPTPRRNVVAVLWIDTQAHMYNPEVVPIPMLSYGEIIEDNAEYVCVRQESHADGGSRDHVAIPRGVIKQIIKVGSFAEPKEFAVYREESGQE